MRRPALLPASALLAASLCAAAACPGLLRAQEPAPALRAAATGALKLPEARYGMPAVTQGGSLYVFGGSGKGGYKGDVIRVTPSSGKVETIATGLVGRRYHTAEAWGRYIYVMGGVTDQGGLPDDVERFDTRTGAVERMAPCRSRSR